MYAIFFSFSFFFLHFIHLVYIKGFNLLVANDVNLSLYSS